VVRIASAILRLIIRAELSAAPPGVNPTTNRIGLAWGNVCPKTEKGNETEATRKNRRNRRAVTPHLPR